MDEDGVERIEEEELIELSPPDPGARIGGYFGGSIGESKLLSASEIWVTSSTWEIVPVVELDNKLVSSGMPGPLWRQANKLYQDFKNDYCG